MFFKLFGPTKIRDLDPFSDHCLFLLQKTELDFRDHCLFLGFEAYPYFRFYSCFLEVLDAFLGFIAS